MASVREVVPLVIPPKAPRQTRKFLEVQAGLERKAWWVKMSEEQLEKGRKRGRPNGVVFDLEKKAKRILFACMVDCAPAAAEIVRSSLERGDIGPYLAVAKAIFRGSVQDVQVDVNVSGGGSIVNAIRLVASPEALAQARADIAEARERHLGAVVDAVEVEGLDGGEGGEEVPEGLGSV